MFNIADATIELFAAVDAFVEESLGELLCFVDFFDSISKNKDQIIVGILNKITRLFLFFTVIVSHCNTLQILSIINYQLSKTYIYKL